LDDTVSASGGGSSGLGGQLGVGGAGSGGAGSGGFAAGGASGVNGVAAACEAACSQFPYASCRVDSSPAECRAACLARVENAAPSCDEIATRLLSCVAAELEPDATCKPSTNPSSRRCAGAGCPNVIFDRCGAELVAYAPCGPPPAPIPFPEHCTGTGTSDGTSCEYELRCGSDVYFATCVRGTADARLASCSCYIDDVHSGGFESSNAIDSACVAGVKVCGAPL
jgi:hypothetical protein